MDKEDDESRTNPVDGLYSSEEIEKFEDMTRNKCHLLDCVLDTFPEHLKTKAKHMCDTLKCKDRLFILPSHEIVIDGKIDRGKQHTRFYYGFINPRTPRGGGGCHPFGVFPCNFFDDSNGENRLIVSDTRDGRHILAYVTSS